MIDKLIPQIKIYLLYQIIKPGIYGCEKVVGVFCCKAEAEKNIFEQSNKFAYRVEERVLQ